MGRKQKTPPEITPQNSSPSQFGFDNLNSNIPIDSLSIEDDITDSVDEQKKLIDEIKETTEEKESFKEKRGRKKKDAEDENKKEFARSSGVLGSIIIESIINRVFPEQPLSETEKNLFNDSFEKVIYKYAYVLNNYQEETGLIAVSLFIIIPRYLDKRKQSSKNENNTADIRENRHR